MNQILGRVPFPSLKATAWVATSASTPRSSAFASSLWGIRYHRSRGKP